MKRDNEVIEEIKKEDKSSFKKFIVAMLVGGIVGGVIGVGTVFAEDINITETIGSYSLKLLETIVPYASPVITLAAMMAVAILYKQSRRLYAEWNEEDEDGMNRIEIKLSIALMITSVALILGYMFFAVAVGKETFNGINMIESICYIAGFIFLIVFVLYAQKKIVNFEKEMNPEKRGSVFDMKFQKKWTDSCDEAELFQIYKAAFASYKAVNIACIVLWMICIFGMKLWDFGYVPVIMVSVIWMVLTISYCLESIKTVKSLKER